jgi:exosortase D (VPLPA-CTERM-specific)
MATAIPDASVARSEGRAELVFGRIPRAWLFAAFNLILVAYIFWTSIENTVDTWLTSAEYNYGPIVPPIAILMLWRDLGRSTAPARGGYLGVAITFVGLILGLVEFLSQTHFPGQLGLFLTIIGLFISLQGEARSRDVWPGLVFLLFALPQAGALQVYLTTMLQLVSSKGAVAIIQMLHIPVFREGNVIDLGQIKLQVAEACSGLRYLFPLATFSFLCAYLFVAHPIKRMIVFLSSVPITITMNILRIGITGILVDRFGIQAAEGFFHDFEGWIVYCLCVALLFAEMKLLCLVGGGDRSVTARLDLSMPARRIDQTLPKKEPANLWRPGMLVGALCIALIALELAMGARNDAPIPREQFSLFPRQLEDWTGTESAVDRDSLKNLNATDYLSVNYSRPSQDIVNVWVAYYESQYSGNAAHSPQVCIPGGGWEIESVENIAIPLKDEAGVGEMHLNRLIIKRGDVRQLVYYWFVEGGHVQSDESVAKFNLMMNAIFHNRRDGALVRFVTPVRGDDVAGAERKLRDFVSLVAPLLPRYLP